MSDDVKVKVEAECECLVSNVPPSAPPRSLTCIPGYVEECGVRLHNVARQLWLNKQEEIGLYAF